MSSGARGDVPEIDFEEKSMDLITKRFQKLWRVLGE